MPLLLALSGWRGRSGALPGQPPVRAASLGLVCGLTYFIGTIYWTTGVLATFGGLPTGLAVAAMLLLASYLALYPALAALVTARLLAGGGGTALFFFPAAWVSTEYARGILFGGFPWVPLGSSQVFVTPVAQMASVAGVYGLSALVALVSATLTFALVSTGAARRRAVVWMGVLVGGVTIWGAWRVDAGSLVQEGTPLSVGLIQGNIAQADKWDPRQARRILTTYIGMTREAVRRGADFVIWPESATPFTFETDSAADALLRDLAREVKRPILFGSEQIVRDPDPRLFNAAFLLNRDGATEAVYRKIHLVPFGEYFPLQGWLSIAAPLVKRFVPFSAGDSVVMLPVAGHQTSTAICYEVVYPALVRRAVLNGSTLLTTITNDAWYGQSSAPYQHFALAAMRAIEQGRYLARAANTGISGVVDPYGRVVVASGIFERTGIVEQVRLLESRTIYSRVGDVVAHAAIALTVIGLWQARPRRRDSRERG